jgi:hypothetical protein
MNAPLSEKPQTVHEAHGIEFYILGGCVEARVKATGDKLPDGAVPALLLLDIAQSLIDIKCYGVAQENQLGQPTYER